MLSLFLLLLLLWFVLSVVLAAWTLWFQGYIYSEPVGQIYWRAPAAGGVLTVFVALWMVFDYRNPGRYRTLTEFTYREVRDYDEVRVPTKKGEDVYKALRNDQYRIEFRKGNRPMPARPEKVIIVDKDTKEQHVFTPVPGEPGRYRDESGATLVAGDWGRVTTYHPGWLFMNLFLNFLHFVAWFLCLWLLLDFQWGHAFGLAIAFWGVMMLFVLPPVLTQTETVARERAAAAARPA